MRTNARSPRATDKIVTVELLFELLLFLSHISIFTRENLDLDLGFKSSLNFVTVPFEQSSTFSIAVLMQTLLGVLSSESVSIISDSTFPVLLIGSLW